MKSCVAPRAGNGTVRRALLLCLMIFLANTSAHAEKKKAPTHEFESLKALYQTLRNTDPHIQRVAEWHDLAQKFEALADKKQSTDNAANSYYHAALLNGEIFSVLQDKQAGNDAVRLWKIVTTEYPKSGYSEESLLKLGETQHALGDNDGAKASFEELRHTFPDSALSVIAEAHEQDIDHPHSKKQIAQDEKNKSEAKNALVIMLDPGHGGEDLGARGTGGLLEKDVTLSIAFELMGMMRTDLNAKVLLTRHDDTFVPLATRMEFANNAHADLFISLHANATPNGKSSGVETYILDNSNDKSSKLLATRENSAAQPEDPANDLQYMLSDLIESSKLPASKTLAQDVQDSVVASVKDSFGKIPDLGVKKAPFYVLVGAHMPSILVEVAFIDNEHDGTLLADKKFRHALALGITSGVKKYLASIKGLHE